jgi:hypothetical protein
MKMISGGAMFEKVSFKTYAYGLRTPEGIIVKFWVPKALLGKESDLPEELPFTLDVPSSKKNKTNGKKSKRKQRDEEDEEEEDDEEDE